MAVAKAVSRTAEGDEVAEESQIMKDLVHSTRWFFPVGIETIMKLLFLSKHVGGWVDYVNILLGWREKT